MDCKKNMSFEECELAILRQAVDKADIRKGRKMINSSEIQEIINIVEDFLRKRKRVCYGGTAINNILPKGDQFYDKSVELPDYDFFSPEALKDAKDLADIYHSKGFHEVEAKAGVHAGTFKVFVNFIPVADITSLISELYKRILKNSVMVAGIHYCPPNYLRMLMFLELSRPHGDISRWEKVVKRITLLNKHYPLRGKNCNYVEIQRLFDIHKKLPKNTDKKIFYITRDSFINQGLVFFGAMANKMYIKSLKKFKYHQFKKIPDFDVLSEDPRQSAIILKEQLENEGIKKISIRKKKGVGEIIAPHYEILVNKETVAFIYEPLACHSYNTIRIKGRKVHIATIDTMLSFYLAFMYVSRPYYDVNRIICMSEYLFKVQQENRLSQKGLLRRFSINCYGKQLTIEKMREEKAEKYKELQKKRGSKEWDFYFLNYSPSSKDEQKKHLKEKKHTKKLREENINDGGDDDEHGVVIFLSNLAYKIELIYNNHIYSTINMMSDGPWYEAVGPDGKAVRSQLCAEKSSLSPLKFLCWQKAVYDIIDADQSDFGSWRGWVTFGLREERKKAIQDKYKKYTQNIPFIKKVLRQYINHRLYKFNGGLRVKALQTHFYKAAEGAASFSAAPEASTSSLSSFVQ